MRSVIYIVRLFVFFLFVFWLSRFIFLLSVSYGISSQSIASIISSFTHGLKTDISTACYLLLLPLLLPLIESIAPMQFLTRIRNGYVALVIFINAVITSAELGLYHEWGTKMNYKALAYLEHPSEIFQTSTPSLLALTFLIIIIQFISGWLLCRRFISNADEQSANTRYSFFALLLIAPLLFVGIRGGVQEIPLQAADSYYSTNPHLNWSAVNSLWNLGQSIAAGVQYGNSNPYKFMPDQEAAQIVSQLSATPCDSAVSILKNPRPNIVLIIFEGWSADLVGSISGNQERNCTPNFDKLASSGLLFTDCLSSGERSDQGLTSILSGFPSLPLSSIVNYTAKVDHLPSLLAPFHQEGYQSLFLFGGQLSYGNLKTLIYHNGFNKVIEEKDIDPAIYRGRLGVHDANTFDILQHNIDGIKAPFFAGVFTQSTHFSYDYPGVKKNLPWAGSESDYANSVIYADSSLGDFFAKAKTKPWFANTLFIMISDHSHVLPWNDNHQSAAMHHIPMLLYGEVLRDEYRGRKITHVVSQQDIPTTLLTQMQLPSKDFQWSKDVLKPCTLHYAYWTFTEGFGFTRDTSEYVYDLANKKELPASIKGSGSTTIRRQGSSYIQRVMQDFISR